MEAEVKKGAKQETGFLSGNEMASLAASQINFHIMGYYPITPSTEVAENLDEMKADGEHDILMIPGEGEHGAAAICYGAATAGARVFNATSAQGLLMAMEAAYNRLGEVFDSYYELSSRRYGLLETYMMEDAEVALVILNSAYET